MNTLGTQHAEQDEIVSDKLQPIVFCGFTLVYGVHNKFFVRFPPTA